MEYNIRQATDKDLPSMITLFHNTVEQINSRDYTPEQIRAWRQKASAERWQELWNSNLSFIVAENSGGLLVGFTSVNPQGYIHSMFVHHLYQGRGIASALLKAVETYALTKKIPRLTSEVSITARAFFESRHFVLEKAEKMDICGIELVNYLMFKQIDSFCVL